MEQKFDKEIAKGKTEGKAEEITEEKREIAIKLLKKNDSLNDIAEITDLTLEEIKKIKKLMQNKLK